MAARLTRLEEELSSKAMGPGLTELVTEELVSAHLSPIDDIRADKAYRLKAATELVRRALAELAGRNEEAQA